MLDLKKRKESFFKMLKWQKENPFEIPVLEETEDKDYIIKEEKNNVKQGCA